MTGCRAWSGGCIVQARGLEEGVTARQEWGLAQRLPKLRRGPVSGWVLAELKKNRCPISLLGRDPRVPSNLRRHKNRTSSRYKDTLPADQSGHLCAPGPKHLEVISAEQTRK